jgi:hypothetical protein
MQNDAPREITRHVGFRCPVDSFSAFQNAARADGRTV